MHVIAGLFDSPAELGIIIVAWIPAAVVGGVVGYLIGKGKGRGQAGALLGAFFGCIGWVVTALLPAVPGSQVTPGGPALPGAPASAPQPGTAGWFPDPFGRFHHRYHDGQQWTDQVASGGRQFTDAPDHG